MAAKALNRIIYLLTAAGERSFRCAIFTPATATKNGAHCNTAKEHIMELSVSIEAVRIDRQQALMMGAVFPIVLG